ncbi:hypothetical protein ACFOSC_19500 [Streptantibioticus rubrisoli]|uniref:Uncharacterized protein n=1 Tax=Streptantibioticus rubrisoli TaxID=1387313 RepID=A0ABT1PLZ0_9ACTN|nr:hypothetical protein [Streptantibioticus rubrisoli]MCQ4046372.1 hypothetical protein [Streptantibioticus rubrisoli]
MTAHEGVGFPGITKVTGFRAGMVVAGMTLMTLALLPRPEGLPAAGVFAVAAVACAAVVAVALVGAVRRRRRCTVRAFDPALVVPEEPWFPATALTGFPADALDATLTGPDAPSLDRLHVAWVFATQGYDAPWIARHFDLRLSVARMLEDAAREDR